MIGELIIHVIHMYGARMKRLGTDNLSRGDLLEGILEGGDTLYLFTLRKGDIYRRPALEDWTSRWWRGSHLATLLPEI